MFSLGFSTFDPALPVSIETLLAQADSRMYEAKAARRRKLRDATAPSSVGSRAGGYPELLRRIPVAGSS